MAAGRFASSFAIRRLGLTRLFVGSGLLCAVCLVLASVEMASWFTILCLGTLGVAVAPFWPTILACAGDRFPQAGASMFSILSTAGGAGGVVGPMVIGLVADQYGLRAGMLTMTLPPLLAVCLLAVFIALSRR